MVEMWSPDVFIYYTELPNGVNEAVMECATGYTIYIDPRQSEAGMLRSFQHAMSHIKKHDFERSDIQKIEDDAHTNKGGNK